MVKFPMFKGVDGQEDGQKFTRIPGRLWAGQMTKGKLLSQHSGEGNGEEQRKVSDIVVRSLAGFFLVADWTLGRKKDEGSFKLDSDLRLGE